MDKKSINIKTILSSMLLQFQTHLAKICELKLKEPPKKKKKSKKNDDQIKSKTWFNFPNNLPLYKIFSKSFVETGKNNFSVAISTISDFVPTFSQKEELLSYGFTSFLEKIWIDNLSNKQVDLLTCLVHLIFSDITLQLTQTVKKNQINIDNETGELLINLSIFFLKQSLFKNLPEDLRVHFENKIISNWCFIIHNISVFQFLQISDKFIKFIQEQKQLPTQKILNFLKAAQYINFKQASDSNLSTILIKYEELLFSFKKSAIRKSIIKLLESVISQINFSNNTHQTLFKIVKNIYKMILNLTKKKKKKDLMTSCYKLLTTILIHSLPEFFYSKVGKFIDGILLKNLTAEPLKKAMLSSIIRFLRGVSTVIVKRKNEEKNGEVEIELERESEVEKEEKEEDKEFIGQVNEYICIPQKRADIPNMDQYLKKIQIALFSPTMFDTPQLPQVISKISYIIVLIITNNYQMGPEIFNQIFNVSKKPELYLVGLIAYKILKTDIILKYMNSSFEYQFLSQAYSEMDEIVFKSLKKDLLILTEKNAGIETSANINKIYEFTSYFDKYEIYSFSRSWTETISNSSFLSVIPEKSKQIEAPTKLQMKTQENEKLRKKIEEEIYQVMNEWSQLQDQCRVPMWWGVADEESFKTIDSFTQIGITRKTRSLEKISMDQNSKFPNRSQLIWNQILQEIFDVLPLLPESNISKLLSVPEFIGKNVLHSNRRIAIKCSHSLQQILVQTINTPSVSCEILNQFLILIVKANYQVVQANYTLFSQLCGLLEIYQQCLQLNCRFELINSYLQSKKIFTNADAISLVYLCSYFPEIRHKCLYIVKTIKRIQQVIQSSYELDREVLDVNENAPFAIVNENENEKDNSKTDEKKPKKMSLNVSYKSSFLKRQTTKVPCLGDLLEEYNYAISQNVRYKAILELGNGGEVKSGFSRILPLISIEKAALSNQQKLWSLFISEIGHFVSQSKWFDVCNLVRNMTHRRLELFRDFVPEEMSTMMYHNWSHLYSLYFSILGTKAELIHISPPMRSLLSRVDLDRFDQTLKCPRSFFSEQKIGRNDGGYLDLPSDNSVYDLGLHWWSNFLISDENRRASFPFLAGYSLHYRGIYILMRALMDFVYRNHLAKSPWIFVPESSSFARIVAQNIMPSCIADTTQTLLDLLSFFLFAHLKFLFLLANSEHPEKIPFPTVNMTSYSPSDPLVLDTEFARFQSTESVTQLFHRIHASCMDSSPRGLHSVKILSHLIDIVLLITNIFTRMNLQKNHVENFSPRIQLRDRQELFHFLRICYSLTKQTIPDRISHISTGIKSVSTNQAIPQEMQISKYLDTLHKVTRKCFAELLSINSCFQDKSTIPFPFLLKLEDCGSPVLGFLLHNQLPLLMKDFVAYSLMLPNARLVSHTAEKYFYAICFQFEKYPDTNLDKFSTYLLLLALAKITSPLMETRQRACSLFSRVADSCLVDNKDAQISFHAEIKSLFEKICMPSTLQKLRKIGIEISRLACRFLRDKTPSVFTSAFKLSKSPNIDNETLLNILIPWCSVVILDNNTDFYVSYYNQKGILETIQRRNLSRENFLDNMWKFFQSTSFDSLVIPHSGLKLFSTLSKPQIPSHENKKSPNHPTSNLHHLLQFLFVKYAESSSSVIGELFINVFLKFPEETAQFFIDKLSLKIWNKSNEVVLTDFVEDLKTGYFGFVDPEHVENILFAEEDSDERKQEKLHHQAEDFSLAMNSYLAEKESTSFYRAIFSIIRKLLIFDKKSVLIEKIHFPLNYAILRIGVKCQRRIFDQELSDTILFVAEIFGFLLEHVQVNDPDQKEEIERLSKTVRFLKQLSGYSTVLFWVDLGKHQPQEELPEDLRSTHGKGFGYDSFISALRRALETNLLQSVLQKWGREAQKWSLYCVDSLLAICAMQVLAVLRSSLEINFVKTMMINIFFLLRCNNDYRTKTKTMLVKRFSERKKSNDKIMSIEHNSGNQLLYQTRFSSLVRVIKDLLDQDLRQTKHLRFPHLFWVSVLLMNLKDSPFSNIFEAAIDILSPASRIHLSNWRQIQRQHPQPLRNAWSLALIFPRSSSSSSQRFLLLFHL
ncbi:protein furry [Anaeramoeba ignava]|uniref:Protein furry n=1 Tax=Anaeramoeba ignava TaxID=1746090 RepID=A0A9Q0L6H8_ANAIG|nr:protein furry [Anaeramoeba ignava]